MTNVTLVHPIHGAKVAICEAEVLADEKEGWSRYTPDTPVADQTEADKPKSRKKPIEQPNEVPAFLTSASDESERK